MRGMKLGNEYAQVLGPLFARIPKATLAAIAVSFAVRNGAPTPSDVRRELLREWETLHDNGIVPQRPPRRIPAVDRLVRERDGQ